MVESKIEPRVLELLRQFEEKYSEQLVKIGEDPQDVNQCKQYQDHCHADVHVRLALKEPDSHTNVYWSRVHPQSGICYRSSDTFKIPEIGGVNWQEFLPKWFRKISFYSQLRSENELEVSWQGRAVDTLEKNHA